MAGGSAPNGSPRPNIVWHAAMSCFLRGTGRINIYLSPGNMTWGHKTLEIMTRGFMTHNMSPYNMALNHKP